MSDRPNILDYGADPTGANSSADALEAMINDINAERRTGYLPKGEYSIDRYCGSLMGGSSLVGELGGPDSLHNPLGQGKNSTCIVIPRWAGMPSGVGADDNWVRFGNGSSIHNVVFRQPDLAASIDSISIEDKGGTGANAIEIDIANYAMGGEVIGSPDDYPPVLQTEHMLNDLGTPRTMSRNGGRIRAWNIGLAGVMHFAYLRDATLDGLMPEERPIEPSGQVHGQSGISGFDIQNIRGFCVGDDIVIGQNGGLSQIINVILGQSYWSEASAAGDQRFVMWRRRNGHVITGVNRMVGLYCVNVISRVARSLFRFKGGGGFQYDGPYLGNPGGKVNGLTAIACGGEQVTSAIICEADSYMHRNNFQLFGSFIDSADPTCTAAVVEIRTDRAIAGSLSHALEDEELPEGPDNPRIFKVIEDVYGFRNDFDLAIQKSSGPLIRSPATDGHDLFKITGDANGLCKSDPTMPIFDIASGSRLKLKLLGMDMTATRGSASTVFSVDRADRVRVVGADFTAMGEIFADDLDVDLSDERLFPATRSRQELIDDLDEDEAPPADTAP